MAIPRRADRLAGYPVCNEVPVARPLLRADELWWKGTYLRFRLQSPRYKFLTGIGAQCLGAVTRNWRDRGFSPQGQLARCHRVVTLGAVFRRTANVIALAPCRSVSMKTVKSEK